VKRSFESLAARKPDCPSLEDWGLYCAGLLPHEKAAAMLSHASDCPSCRGLLADLREESVAHSEVDAAPLELKSATPAWKREMLDRLTTDSGEPAVPVRSAVRLVRQKWWIAAAAVIIAAVVTAGSANSMLWLLGRSSNRALEFRLAHAPYQPITVERGASAPEGPMFLMTKLFIAFRDRLGAGGARWMYVKGREALLERRPDRIEAAIDALESAHAATPEDIDVANDLAIAYMVRSATLDQANAIRVLEQVPEIQRNAALYFNLALAYEAGREYNKALEIWGRFLKLEPAGGWADEARQHQDTIRRRLQGRVNSRSRRSEDAITVLAAQGFRSSADLNLESIYEDMASGHDDPWLKDLSLALARSSNKSAVATLQSAVRALLSGEISTGEERARQALAAFVREGNTAGADFAAFELSYALQKLSKPDECVSTARERLPALKQKRYRWLEIQLGLQLGVCQAMAKKFEPSYEAVESARQAAIAAKYPGLGLRALGMASGILREVGSYREALAMDMQGIERYWAAEGTKNNAYQSYFGLAVALHGLQYTETAAAAMGEAVHLAADLPDRSQEAMARARYAEILIEAGRTSEAAVELDRSEDIFTMVPASPSAQLYRSYARLSHAYLDGQHGDVERGLETTAKLQAMPASLENPSIQTRLSHVQAQLLAKAGRLTESEQALRRLLTLGDAIRHSSPAAADRSAMTRRVAEAVNLLAGRYLDQGNAAEAWRLWTQYNTSLVTTGSEEHAAQLIFADFPSGSAALVSSAAGLHAVRLPAAAKIAALSRDLRQLVSRPDTSLKQIRFVSRQLHQVIFEPLQKYLAADDVLYIAAAPPFSGIPFGALLAADGDWLADRYAIAYSPPAGNAREAKPAGLTADMQLLAVSYSRGSNVLGRSLPPLSSETELEVEAASHTFPRHTLLNDKESARENVLRSLAAANVFQFSGHAITSADDAALVLAPGNTADSPGRLLWASEFSTDLLRNLRLAVLAACSTGRPVDDSRYPSADMARAFLSAGVPMVIASNWDVDSIATAKLIRSFYENIHAGLTPERAVSAARSALRYDPAYAHPYYWAAFALYRR
jgi:CHAT domain-containing protein